MISTTSNLTSSIKGFYLPRLNSNTSQDEYHSNSLSIILPGFLDSCLHRHIVDLATKLSIKSNVISFDPPGTWSSGWSDRDYQAQNYIKQALTLIQKYGANKSINIIGHSLGGQMAISIYRYLHQELQPRIKHIVIIETPGVIPKITKALYVLSPDRYFTRVNPGTGEKEVHKQGFSFIYDMSKIAKDNLSAIKTINCKKLFIAGSLDKQVSPDKVKLLFDNATQNKSYQLLPIHHNYLKYPNELELVAVAVIDFLR